MPTNPADHRIFDLASRQHGVIARRQLRALEIDRDQIRRRLRQGSLREVSARVLAVAGSPDTLDQRLMAAVLDLRPPAALSHETAGWRWDLPGLVAEPIHVTGHHARTSQRRADLAIVHQPRRIFTRHIVEVGGIPTTTPALVIFDLANQPDADPHRIERLLDRAWSRRLLDHSTVSRTLDELAVRGRRGITLMRELLADRPPDYVPAESGLEDRFRSILGDSLAAQFRTQVNIAGDVDWIGRVDFVHERSGVIVEVDSTTYHTTITDRRRDQERQEKLEAAGWTVIRVREHDVWHDPSSVIGLVQPAISRNLPRTG